MKTKLLPTRVILPNDEIYTKLTSPLSKSFASWHAIKNDMEFAIEALNLVIEMEKGKKQNEHTYTAVQDNESLNKDEVIEESLYRAAIISYSKSFAEKEGRNIGLNEDTFKRKQELLPFHRELLAERNSYHAHAGITPNEELIPIIIFSIKDKSKSRLASLNFSMVAKKTNRIQNYIKVAQFILSHADSKATECAKKLHSGEVVPTLDKLFEQARIESEAANEKK